MNNLHFVHTYSDALNFARAEVLLIMVAHDMIFLIFLRSLVCIASLQLASNKAPMEKCVHNTYTNTLIIYIDYTSGGKDT
jgi:hypothetical protein